MTSRPLPQLIAHRGERMDYPENTIAALTAALDAGADGVEFDIQFAADGTPMVLHDRDLRRTGGQRAFVNEVETGTDRPALPAHEPDRFGERFAGECVPTLEAAIDAIADHTHGDALVFAEIKTETLPAHDVNAAVRRVLDDCSGVANRLVVISLESFPLRAARSQGAPRIGWAVSPGDGFQREHARVLQPDYLFADRADVTAGAGSLWRGDWRWVVYEVNEPSEVRRLGEAGVWGIETGSIARLRSALVS